MSARWWGECPLCKKPVIRGKVELLFKNGDRWIVDSGVGQLADKHNIPIPCELWRAVLGGQLLDMRRTATVIIEKGEVDFPKKLMPERRRTVKTDFQSIWELFLDRAVKVNFRATSMGKVLQ